MGLNRIYTIGLLIILLCLLGFGVAYCHQRDKAKSLGDELAKSDTRTGSAVQAIEQIDKLGERGQIADKELEKAHEAIRQADPAERDAIARRQLECLQHGAACNGVQ